MADYHIYIHSEMGRASSPTKSWNSESGKNSVSDTNSWQTANAKFSRVANTIQNPDSLVSGAVGAAAKAIPAVAIAYTAIKLVDYTLTTINSFATIQTGDYRFQTSYGNFKASINAGLHPFSTLMTELKRNTQISVNERRLSQERALFGDEEIIGLTNFGV